MRLFVLVLCLWGSVAMANVPISERPLPREPFNDFGPGTELAPEESHRPALRGKRPKERRDNFIKVLLRKNYSAIRKGQNKNKPSIKGSVCGDPEIRGVQISPIPGRLRGCGLADGVEVREVAGVGLSTPAKIDCRTARALKTWVETGAKRAIGGQGGGLASLKVVGHYTCRTRNHKKGAKISEHGKGRAIDISGVTLKDGTFLSVLKDWRSKKGGGPLRTMHRSACGVFGTVLGPASDRYHQDHFHFDTAQHRSGSYCR